MLKNRWKVPCLVTLVSLVVSAAVGSAGAVNSVIELVASGISGIVLVAQLQMYFKFIEGKAISFSDFIAGFESWLNAILGTFWFVLWTSLWSLLFLIPGIVKGISYSMMFWVIAENPEIGAIKAMNISKIMTKGHKSDLFCLGLSFIGWIFLSLLSFGIGFIWLTPYMYLSYTKAYIDLKRMAFETGVLKPADFYVAHDGE